MKESLVEVSPSTVMRLKERAAASASMRCSAAWLTAASVATKPSMVAMSGWIMPAPLAMPVTVTVLPPRLSRREHALGTVSVVMIAAAAPQPVVLAAIGQRARQRRDDALHRQAAP